jgi:hypothetical protein
MAAYIYHLERHTRAASTDKAKDIISFCVNP